MSEAGLFLFGLVPWSVLGLWLWRKRCTASTPFWLSRTVVAWALGIWVASQILGLGNALAPGPLRLCWMLALGASAVYLWRDHARAGSPARRGGFFQVESPGRLLLVLALPLLGITLVRAFVSPPNTVDVLSYHLPRQLLWLQQGSLDFYPTLNDRENMMPPLAEVIGVQFLALSGDDRWANIIGWCAYAGSACLAGLLARMLGARRPLAAAAGLAVLLVPMGYHEAANAKNDLLAGFWQLCLALELAWVVRRGPIRLRMQDAFWPALALSAAWLTKSTTMVVAPVLLVCAGGALIWQSRDVGRRLLAPLAMAAGIVLVCIAPFHLRNINHYGTLLGQHRAEDGGAQANTAFTPCLIASNLLRHATVHVLLPWDPWNEFWLKGVRAAHRIIGADPEDRRTTLWTLPFDPVYRPDMESEAGAPAHFLIGLPLLLLIALAPGRRRARWCAVAVILAGLTLVVVLKWQPWLARLHQGLFFIGVATVAAAWPPLGKHMRDRFVLGGVLVLLVVAWWPGRETEGRRLWSEPSLFSTSREANYFSLIGGAEERVAGLAHTVIESGARSILIPNVHDVAYPLMRTLKQNRPDVVFAEVPCRYAPASPADALVLMEGGQVQPLWRNYAGRRDWRLVGEGLSVGGVYLPAARVAELRWGDSLPIFSGWHQAFGLGLTHAQVAENNVIPAIRFTSDMAAIVLPALPQGGELRGTFLGAPRADLKTYWQERADAEQSVFEPLWGNDLPEGHPFVIPLPSAPTTRRLYFQIRAGSYPVFTRLQLQDHLTAP